MLHAVMHVACDNIILCKSALRHSMAQGAVGSLLCHSPINEAPPRPRGNSGTCQDDPNKTTTKFIPIFNFLILIFLNSYFVYTYFCK